MELELKTARAHRDQIQFYIVDGGDRTDDMISFDGIRFASNGGPMDWDEIENADEAADAARTMLRDASRALPAVDVETSRQPEGSSDSSSSEKLPLGAGPRAVRA